MRLPLAAIITVSEDDPDLDPPAAAPGHGPRSAGGRLSGAVADPGHGSRGRERGTERKRGREGGSVCVREKLQRGGEEGVMESGQREREREPE